LQHSADTSRWSLPINRKSLAKSDRKIINYVIDFLSLHGLSVKLRAWHQSVPRAARPVGNGAVHHLLFETMSRGPCGLESHTEAVSGPQWSAPHCHIGRDMSWLEVISGSGNGEPMQKSN